MRLKLIFSSFSTIFLSAVLLFSQLSYAQNFPQRGIEFVAGYGPGGGHDTMLRTMARIIKEHNVVAADINVVNKPGGSGATSLGYLNGHKGDGHYLMAATSSFITTPLTAKVGLSYEDFTPIARLGIDPTILVISPRSKITSLDDIKNAGKVLNVAGGGKGGIEHIATLMVGDALGVKLNYVPFQGDGEVTTALLSSQVDFALVNPGAVSEFIEAGRLQALAISTDERSELFPDLPTFKEQGYDVVVSVFRGVVAAKDISEEEKTYLSDMIVKLKDLPQWKSEYLTPNSIVPSYLNADDFANYLKQTQELYKTTLTRLELLGN